ncbi:MAG: hypothetical protein PHU46_06700 [Rhodocyclaceae bacterium]|nr:hypothetical protein [Rhodocyclaceae bacterium]
MVNDETTAAISRFRALLYLILVLLVFYPLAYVGYTTNDDAQLAIVTKQLGGIFPAAHFQAAALGRFMVMISFPITQIPYLVDDPIWSFGVKIFGFAVLFSTVYWSITKVFRSSAFALLVLAIIVAFMQNGWNHDLFTSYPLIFNFYAACFFASVGLFSMALEIRSVSKAWAAALLYFFSMGTEVFVSFSFIFPVLAVTATNYRSGGVVACLRGRLRFLLPIAAGLATYLLAYVAWRYVYAAHHSYDGNSFTGASVSGFFKVIFYYGVNGFPILSFHGLPSKFGEVYRQSPFLILPIVIKALVASALVVTFIRKPMLSELSTTFIRRALGVALALVFLVNLLLALTSKYQAWVEIGSRSFTYTFYSMIFAAIVLSLSLALASRSDFIRQNVGRRISVGLIGCLVFLVAGAVGVNNQFYFQDQALSNRKWKLFDFVMKSEEFRAIPEGAVIYAPSLPAHQRGIAQALAPYWNAYVKAKVGKSVDFRTEGCEAGKPCYYMSFTQDVYRDEQYMVLARSDGNDRRFAKTFSIYAVPHIGGRVLNGFFSGARNGVPSMSVNGISVNAVADERMFSLRLPGDVGARSTKVNVSSEQPIFLDQLIVAIGTEPIHVAPVQVRLSQGFYPLEGTGDEAWSWSGGGTVVEVENFRQESLRVSVSGEVNSIHPEDTLVVSAGGRVLRSISLRSGEWTNFSVVLDVPTGVSKLELCGRKAAIRPSAADPRLLSFRLRGLKGELNKLGGQ